MVVKYNWMTKTIKQYDNMMYHQFIFNFRTLIPNNTTAIYRLRVRSSDVACYQHDEIAL
jgi:hypothetical protein